MTSREESFPQHMSPADSIAWSIEENPLLRSTVALVLKLDRAPDETRLRDRLELASRAFPRLRQRVVAPPVRLAPPLWSADPSFDLDFHLRRVRAGGDRSLRTVLDLAATLAMQAFDRARPLWECTVVDDLDDGGAAVLLKIHHSLTDGVGGVLLMQSLFDTERDGGAAVAEAPPAEEAHDPGLGDLLWDSISEEVRRRTEQARSWLAPAVGAALDPIGSVKTVALDLASVAHLLAPVDRPFSPLMTGRSPRYHFDSFRVPVAALKDVAHRAGGKLNDAFLAGVARGVGRYHERLGAPVSRLRINMPVNLRGADTAAVGGNRWAPLRFTLPVVTGEPLHAIREVRAVVAGELAEPALHLIDAIADLLDHLPARVVTQVFGAMLQSLDLAASNVPGVPFPLFLGGARIDAMHSFAPTGGAALNACLLSYCDQATIAVNTDPAAVLEPALLLSCLRESFAEIVAA